MMKFKEFSEIKTLVKKGMVDCGQVGTIIHVLNNPGGYIVEFCNNSDFEPWAVETYYPSEIELIKIN